MTQRDTELNRYKYGCHYIKFSLHNHCDHKNLQYLSGKKLYRSNSTFFFIVSPFWQRNCIENISVGRRRESM